MMCAAIPAGMATGLAAWLMAGGASAKVERLDALSADLRTLSVPKSGSRLSRYGGAAELLANPVFALTTGAGALREPALRLDGVSISARRTAALVSIDGKLAEWMGVGESRDGVTLQGLTSSSATFETPLGAKQLALGEQSAASAPAQPSPEAMASAATQTIVDQMPPGFRSPPPPASAPATQP